MQTKNLIIFFLFGIICKFSVAQPAEAVIAYIDKYKDIAISEMQRTGVPASIKLAQGIHETDAGRSVLVTKSNNHFGIKCKSNWNGASVSHDDDARGECFRKYNDPSDSYKDHSDFLKNGQRYAFLFQLDPTDFEAWAYGLKKAGYATNPKYSQLLIKLIREYNLQDYTLIAMGRMKDQPVYASGIEEAVPGREDARMVIASTGPTAVSQVSVIPAVAVTMNYPTGEFHINDTRVVFVKKETSFLAIAEKYNVPLARLFEFNDMRPVDVAVTDQLIFLQRKRKTGAHEFHVMQEGETLYDVAQSEAIRLESIYEYNLLQPGMQPAVGEKINLREKATTMPRLFEKPRPVIKKVQPVSRPTLVRGENISEDKTSIGGLVMHTVEPRETVYSISKKYDVSVASLVNWNSIKDYELSMGQQLKIYK